ncbi:MAG: hypothetical protein ACJAXY_000667 [Nonlabens sp.]
MVKKCLTHRFLSSEKAVLRLLVVHLLKHQIDSAKKQNKNNDFCNKHNYLLSNEKVLL